MRDFPPFCAVSFRFPSAVRGGETVHATAPLRRQTGATRSHIGYTERKIQRSGADRTYSARTFEVKLNKTEIKQVFLSAVAHVIEIAKSKTLKQP